MAAPVIVAWMQPHMYVDRMDPAQVHEGLDSDGHLFAVHHVELLDPAQVHENRVRDPAAHTHVHIVQPCARIASNMNKIRIDDVFANKIDHTHCW